MYMGVYSHKCMYVYMCMYVCMEFREGQYKFYPIVFMYPCKYESYTIVNFSWQRVILRVI